MVDPNYVDTNLPPGDPLITFRLIEGGSKRSRDKLVDSLGYSYTIKRRFVFIVKKFDFFTDFRREFNTQHNFDSWLNSVRLLKEHYQRGCSQFFQI